MATSNLLLSLPFSYIWILHVFLNDCVGIRFWYWHIWLWWGVFLFFFIFFWYILVLVNRILKIIGLPNIYHSEDLMIWKDVLFKNPSSRAQQCAQTSFLISKSTLKGQTKNVTRLLSILDLTWHFQGFQSNNQQESMKVFNQKNQQESMKVFNQTINRKVWRFILQWMIWDDWFLAQGGEFFVQKESNLGHLQALFGNWQSALGGDVSLICNSQFHEISSCIYTLYI